MVTVATPLVLTAAVASVVVPFRKITDPVGEDGPGLVTWAVKVTACAELEGFGVELIAVVELYLLTGTVMVAD